MKYTNLLYALFVEGGGVTTRQLIGSTTDEGWTQYEHKEGTFVVHADDNDNPWVLLFEDIDHAERVVRDYFDATGQWAHPKLTTVDGLDYEQNVRLYRGDGSWEDVTRQDYLANCS